MKAIATVKLMLAEYLTLALALVVLNWRNITEDYVLFRVVSIDHSGVRVRVVADGIWGRETLEFADPFAARQFHRLPLPDLLQEGKVYGARVYGLWWSYRKIISVEE